MGFNENARLRAIILCWPLRAQLEVRAGRKKALHLEELPVLGNEPEIDLGGKEKKKKKEKNGDLVDDPSVFLYKYSCLLPTLAHVTAGH